MVFSESANPKFWRRDKMALGPRDEKWLNKVKALLAGLREFAENQEEIERMWETRILRFQENPTDVRERQIRTEFELLGAIAPRKEPNPVGILDVSRWDCHPKHVIKDRCMALHCSTCRRCRYISNKPHENQQGQPCKPPDKNECENSHSIQAEEE